jgi:hypothetical protein
MTLYEKILGIYPELADYDFGSGAIRLQDNNDGNGQFIAKWEHPTLTRPTDEELA